MLLQATTYELNRLIIFGIAAMLTLAGSIVLFVLYYQRRVIRHQREIKRVNDQKQLELIQASLQGEEEERMRIAADLHDDVGITLASVKLYLSAAFKKNADPKIITQTQALLDESIAKVRSISHKLQPALLQQLGLYASLDSFASMISKSGKVKMEYTGNDLPRFADSIELAVYRIVQELTNNIIRHAQANNIYIETQLHPQFLKVNMNHDGAGLTEEMFQHELNKKGAIGLKNIFNRLKSINATIIFEQDLNKIYHIIVTIPITPQ